MTPKEKLESIQSLATDIDILSSLIHNLYTTIYRPPSSKVTVSYGTTPGTTADGYTEKTLVKILKLKKERMQAINTRHSRIDGIRKIPYANIRRIVYMRYVECKAWNDIAAAVFVSVRHAQRLLQQGIECYAVINETGEIQ